MLKSKLWKWVTIIATLVGLITGAWFFYDKATTDRHDVIVEYGDGSRMLEQRVPEDVIRNAPRNPDGSKTIRKGIVIPPEEESNDTDR